MPDKKLTDNEIKKALECCASEQYTCDQCPYQEIKHYDYDNGFEIMPNGKQYDDWSCERWLNVDLLDLINRLQAENERLEKVVEYKQGIIDVLFTDNAKLLAKQSEIQATATTNVLRDMELAIEIAKAEAYKEFAELSIKRICEQVSAPTPSESYIVEKCNQAIYNLLKELVGEDNA